MMRKLVMMTPMVPFQMDRCLFDKKEEVLDEYFFDHLKDDNSDEHHGESEKYDNFNKHSEERNDCSVDLVCNVFAENSKISPEQCIMTILLKKQLAKKNSSNIQMSLRKSLPESIIDQLTTQKYLSEQPNTQLTATLEAVQVDNNAMDQAALSDKEALDLQLTPNWIPSMKPKGDHLVRHCVIGNVGNATCQIAQQYAVSSKTVATTLYTKGAPFYGPGHMDKMSRSMSLLGAFAKSTTWTTTKTSCQIRPTMEQNDPWAWPNTEKDIEWKEPDMSEFIANGLWFAPNCKECFLINK
jgi:hypothetical protein